MTVLNFAVGANEVAVVTDSLASGYSRPVHTTKVASFPHLAMIVAGSGRASLTDEWQHMVGGGCLFAADVRDVVAKAPAALRALWSRLKPPIFHSRILHAGMVGEEAQVFLHEAPDFEPLRVSIGAYCQPQIVVAPLVPDKPVPTLKVSQAHLDAISQPGRTFRDYQHTIIAEAPLQVQAFPATCGGSLILTHMDVGGIRQTVISEPVR